MYKAIIEFLKFTQIRPDINIFHVQIMYRYPYNSSDSPYLIKEMTKEDIEKFLYLYTYNGSWIYEEPGEPDEYIIQIKPSESNVFKIQKYWKMYLAKKRMDTLREDLMKKVWNPKRLQAQGYFEEL